MDEKNSKKYDTQAEYQTRFVNYKSTLRRVQLKNANAKAINSTATYAVNKFADLTPEEFSVRLGMKGYVPRQRPGVPVANPAPRPQASSFDWRKNGGVTAVKDQGQCGSCWAFSCTESIESVYMIASKPNQPWLSPQQIVDCDTGDAGCNGGDLPTCYAYVQSAGGLETDADYPYNAQDGSCNADASKEQDPINGFNYVIPQGSTDENKMASYLESNSPMSIIVDASSWSDYSGGVLKAAECGQDLDHAVQAVGFDLTNKFWIVRNSWGADWGESGYLRLEFGANTCGMDSEVTVPTIGGKH